jgi:hypothetical protein
MSKKKVIAKSLSEYILAMTNKQEVEPSKEFLEDFKKQYMRGRKLCEEALRTLPEKSLSEQELCALAFGMIHFAGDFIKSGTESNNTMMTILSTACGNIVNIINADIIEKKREEEMKKMLNNEAS